MKKGKRSKTRREQKRNFIAKPDDVFESKFLQIARFGRVVQFRSKLNENGIKLLNAAHAKRLPDAIDRLDGLIEEIVTLVKKAPSATLLRRAYWERVTLHVMGDEDGVSDRDSSMSLRKIDYVQSLIASVPQASEELNELSDEEWVRLGDAIESLFTEFAAYYLPCERAAAKLSDPEFDEEHFSFYQQAQLHWCNVRGERYAFHEIAHLRELLLQHDAKLQEVFGISAEEIVQNLKKILDSLTHGVGKVFIDMDALMKDCDQSPNDVSKKNELIKSADIWERFDGYGLFDLEMVTNLPRAFLERLAWEQGEDAEFMNRERAGWPTKIWPVFKRPFLKVDGRILCFDAHSLFDRFYRNLQRLVVSLSPGCQRKWAEGQQLVTEALPFSLLSRLLVGGVCYQSVYYRWYAGGGGKKHWCEVDGLFLFEDVLFVIEVKAGAFTYTSPAVDFKAYKGSLKNLLENPAKQGMRFVDYLNSEEKVGLFDESHNLVAELSKGEFDRVVVLAVTLDPFTELAAKSRSLGKLGIHVGDGPVLPVSVDDLRVMVDLFPNPLQFLHFIEMRIKALRSEFLQLDDELDHVGMYLKCNDYVLHVDDLSEGGRNNIRWIGYRKPIDDYYSSLLREDGSALLPLQEMPTRMREILDLLVASERHGKRRVANALLNGSSEFRTEFCETIGTVLRRQYVEKKWIPFHFGEGMNITVVCWQTWSGPDRDREEAIRFAQTSMLAAMHDEEILLELVYDENEKLVGVDYEVMRRRELGSEELERLEMAASELRKHRVSKAIAKQGKMGRNEKCPCGSGRKYKKCCGA